MKILWQLIYYILVYPGIVVAAHILAVPLKKVRRGLFPKYTTARKLKR